MRKQAIIDELNELMNIPWFERIIYHKLEELKISLREEITMYRKLKSNFKKTHQNHLYIFDNEHQKKIPTYRFELNKQENDEWILTKIEPFPNDGTKVDDIVPKSIINHISCVKTDRLRIHHYSGSGIPPKNGKSFDVEFTKYSDFHAFGTVHEKPDELNWNEKSDQLNLMESNNGKIPDEIKYDELFYFMQKYPHVKYYILSYFYMKLRPDLEP
jgi:hypothetical protein